MTNSSTHTYEYIYINSRNSKKSDTTSRMNIELTTPLLNAKTVSVCSFSTANEFFNIREPNNTVTIGVLSEADSAQFEPTLETYTIPPGLYDMPTVIAKLNELMEAIQPNSVWCTFAQTPQGKTTFSVQSNSTPKKRAFLYSEVFYAKFSTTLLYRLGFSNDQCAYADDVRLGGSDVLRFTKVPTDGSVTEHYVINYRGFPLTEQQFADVDPKMHIFKLLKSSFGTGYTNDDGSISTTRMTGDTLTSTYIAFESPCSYLLLKSNLVTNFRSVVLDEQSNTYVTHNDNILQKIDVDTNIYSYLHFKSKSSDSYKHTLSGKPISHFNLELCDNHGDIYSKNHHKPYSCVLKFEIEENHAIKDLNEKQIQLNHALQYNSRHIC
jgi:hypothetical protein